MLRLKSALIVFISTGCAMLNLNKQVAESLASTVLVGQVASATPEEGVIVVAAYSRENGEWQVADYTVRF